MPRPRKATPAKTKTAKKEAQAKMTQFKITEMLGRFAELGGEIADFGEGKRIFVGDIEGIIFPDVSAIASFLSKHIDSMEVKYSNGDRDWFAELMPVSPPTPVETAGTVGTEKESDTAIKKLANPVLGIPTVTMFDATPQKGIVTLKDQIEQMAIEGVTRAELCQFFNLDGGLDDIELARSLAILGVSLRIERSLNNRNLYKPHLGFCLPNEPITR